MRPEKQLSTIRLYGWLGKKYGRVHRFYVSSVKEATAAMCALIPGFQEDLYASKDRGIGYACFLGKKNISEEELYIKNNGEDIRIAPVVMGSKSRWAQGLMVVVGVVLTIYAPYLGGGYWSAFAGSIGASLAIGGIMQLITPTPKGLGTNDGPDNGASYNFNGAVNTTAQGNPVPILYGEMYVGSATISAGIYAEDLSSVA